VIAAFRPLALGIAKRYHRDDADEPAINPAQEDPGYAGDLSQAEIGRRIGVSQMHVSRILRRVLTRLGEDHAAPAITP
jgi:hypothetical protein